MIQNNTYRNLTKADFPAFKRLINDAWRTETYIRTPVVLNAALDAYMRLCLLSATFAAAAVQNGSVIGIITGTVKRNKPLFSRLKNLLCLLRSTAVLLCAPGTDRRAAFEYLTEFSYHRRLFKGRKKNYGGSIDFFVVSSESRGRGTGKFLLNLMFEYFKEHEAGSIYLFTDTWCDYRFYDRQGFTAVSSLALPPDPGQREENRIFLYEKTV